MGAPSRVWGPEPEIPLKSLIPAPADADPYGMVSPVVLAVASVGCFLALAHAAVTSSGPSFRRMTGAMAALAILVLAVSPAAGVALLAPVLLSRRLANAPVPATVDELLGSRRASADR